MRAAVQLREAIPDDVEPLSVLLTPMLGRVAEEPAGVQEVRGNIAQIAGDPDRRLMVAVVEDRVVGAVLLIRAPLSPLQSETAVHVLHLQVRDDFRRHGVGRALMEEAVSWAEEKDTSYVVAAASVGSRDANRFMARLGLGQLAVVRATTVAALRAKLPVEPPAAARVGVRTHRSVTQVLAQRRSLRRAQAKA